MFFTQGFSQFYNVNVEAKINLVNKSEFIEITGNAFNKSEIKQNVRYVLSVIKDNNNTKSSNKQEGRVIIGSSENVELSKTIINKNEKDRIIILLLLFDLDNQIIGKDRIVINGNKEDENKTIILKQNIKETNKGSENESDGVEISGIVLDETKTKPGRDFYKMFYSLYLANNIKGNKIVLIKEVLVMVNTTAITVKVGDVVVYKFIVKPQESFLKTASQRAIKEVSRYFQKNKNNSNNIKNY